MTAIVQNLVTSGVFELDGGSWEVDNNVWVVGDGSEVLAPANRLVFVFCVDRIVNSSGAVSPAARATASSAPLVMPPTAAGSTTPIVTRALVAPSA